eukprot:2407523-Amphidinium_carterae.1
MGQQLMLRINQQTTFDEVHQWISNYFNSTYAGADEDKGAIGNINEQESEQQEEWNGYNDENEEYYEEYNEEDVKYIIQMVNKGKGKTKGKSRGKTGKDKGGRTARQGTSRPIVLTRKAKEGRTRQEDHTKVNGTMAKAMDSHHIMVINSKATVVTVDSH